MIQAHLIFISLEISVFLESEKFLFSCYQPIEKVVTQEFEAKASFSTC